MRQLLFSHFLTGNGPDDVENRNDIISLEEKIAWLEDLIDRQSKELSDLYDKMDKLERQFKVLYSKVGDPYATRSQKDEVPPPHY